VGFPVREKSAGFSFIRRKSKAAVPKIKDLEQRQFK
jgi:hypothetical protein